MESESLSFPLQIVVRFWKSSFFYLVGFWQPAHVISFSSFLHRRRDGEDVSWICKILINLHTKELLHCVLRSGAGGKAWEVHRNSINGQPETRLRKGMEMCERVSSSKFPPNGGKCFVWKKLTNLLFMELGFCRWFINSVTGVSIPQQWILSFVFISKLFRESKVFQGEDSPPAPSTIVECSLTNNLIRENIFLPKTSTAGTNGTERRSWQQRPWLCCHVSDVLQSSWGKIENSFHPRMAAAKQLNPREAANFSLELFIYCVSTFCNFTVIISDWFCEGESLPNIFLGN